MIESIQKTPHCRQYNRRAFWNASARTLAQASPEGLDKGATSPHRAQVQFSNQAQGTDFVDSATSATSVVDGYIYASRSFALTVGRLVVTSRRIRFVLNPLRADSSPAGSVRRQLLGVQWQGAIGSFSLPVI
jgi:hypothetical protein